MFVLENIKQAFEEAGLFFNLDDERIQVSKVLFLLQDRGASQKAGRCEAVDADQTQSIKSRDRVEIKASASAGLLGVRARHPAGAEAQAVARGRYPYVRRQTREGRKDAPVLAEAQSASGCRHQGPS